MRYIYSILVYLLAPFIPFYLKKRAKKNPKYSLFWDERFGFKLRNTSTKPIIWLHAVSVGETKAMHKLITLLHQQYPQYQILITQMTPTGRDTAQNLYPFAILHYLPYDLPHAVHNFYSVFKPILGIIMETEIWPNLFYSATKHNIPLYIVNARLSNKSLRGYLRFSWFIRPVLNNVTGILCQDKLSENNFKRLIYNISSNNSDIESENIQNLKTVGNTKFDLVLENKTLDIIELFKQRIDNRKVVTFASTRDGEEDLILQYIDQLRDYLVLIIPRHPERFTLLEKLLIEKNIAYQKRSDNENVSRETKVVIGDSLGEMLAYYAISDIAVIGGSFCGFGGQNPIEAIFMHKPVIFGDSMYNFTTVANDAITNECAIQVVNMNECINKLNCILIDKVWYDKLKNNCQLFIDKYQGASQRVLEILQKHL